MNQKEREAEIKDLAFLVNHEKIKLEKQIRKYTLKIKEPKSFISCIKYGYYDKKLEFLEARLKIVKQYEARMAKIIEDFDK